ncbi:MAG TPA: AsmA-like C-terminal region-containing protein [Burkholderiales bacterium]|nr:AsmA-like C-terminal region-containing protein [Burkholderiales bacterium]
MTKPHRHRLLAGLGLLVALALGLAATLLTVERSIRLDGLRGRVAAALTRALGGEAHVDGPVYLLTGMHPGVEVEGLRLAGAAGAVRWSARAHEGRLRLDLRALLARRIEISALDLEDVRLCTTPVEGGDAQRGARSGAGWRFAGIERLRARRVSVVANASCTGEPLASIDSLEASLLAARPLRVAASGNVNGAPWRAELRGPPWAALGDAGAAPFELSAELAGARLSGTLEATLSPASIRAQLALEAGELLPLMRLLDAPFKSFGPLHARAQLAADAAHLDLRLDEARLGPAAFTGQLTLERSGARPRAGIALQADALNAVALQRWLDASLDRPRLQPGRLIRKVMEAVRASDGALTVRLARLDAAPVALQGVGAEGGWKDGVLRAKLTARYGKSPLDGTLEADMRAEDPAIVLEARARALGLPREAGAAGSIGEVSAKLVARAAPAALAQSARGTLELRDASLRLPFAGGRLPPLELATARAEWHRDGTLRVNGTGALGRTRGRFEASRPPAGAPILLRAEFELLDLAELTQGQPKGGAELWTRELLPRGTRLPDTDLQIAAARVVLPQFGATVGRTTLEVSARGATLAEWAADAKLTLEARDGRVVMQFGATPLEASIAQARLVATPDARTTLSATGTFVGSPFDLRAGAAPLATLLPAAGGEFDVSGRLGEVAVSAAWQRDAPLRVKLDAPRLDAFDALLARSLPSVGPVSLEASLQGLGEARRSAEIAFALGESRLNGNVAEARVNGRRRVDVALASPLLRLQDFGLQQGTEVTGRASAGSAGTMEAKVAEQLKRAEAQVVALRRALREVDGRFALGAERVSAGAAELGRGEVIAMLEQGRLRVAPLKLDSPKGKLSLELDADLSSDDPRYRLDGDLDRFQYGALFKDTGPARRAEGSLSMNVALAAHGPLEALASNIEGRADFAVFPTDYSSRALDVWGGGLMRALGTVLDKQQGARINCAVAAFNVSGGVARSEALMLDSTSTRAAGELKVDLRDHRLKGFMAPKPKTPHLVSPLVPVGIDGTLEKPEVGVDVAGIPRAAVRTFYFVPTYLYDAFLGGAMPADGSEDCVRAYRRMSTN